jgi:hypothetical protein
MAFVDDYELQVAQEHRPAGVVAQQRQVNHVRIGENPSRSLAREPPHFAGAVAVVRTRGDIRQRHGFCERHRGSQLVVTERLGGGQIQCPRTRILFQGRQYRQLVRQGLTRCSAGAQHDVTAVVGQIRGRELMRPQPLDTPIKERPHHIWVGPLRPRPGSALTRRQVRDMAQRLFVWIRAVDHAGEELAAEIRPRT